MSGFDPCVKNGRTLFQGGPPFALSPTVVEALLAPAGFESVSLTEVPEEQWARGRPEFLYRWRRTAAA